MTGLSSKTIVTGVSGLVAFHLAEQLCMSYPDMEVAGICGTANESIRDLLYHPNFRFAEADVTEPAGYDRELEGAGTVYHLAAQSAIYKARRGIPVGDLRINVQGTLQLALCAAAAGVGKLVFTSGGAVYASQNNDRARSLGWTPRCSLATGVAETRSWLLPGRALPLKQGLCYHR